MSIRPWVVVEAPDSRGLRRVTIGSETVGSAWSLDELRELLSRLGYPEDLDMEDPASICWRGGDSRTWPDRAGRRRATLVLMVAGLLAAMALNAVIGWPDALGALTFAQRMTGALFVLSGAVLGVAAIAALDYWGRRQYKVSGAVVLLGVLVSLATDSLLVFMWLEEREYTPYLWVFMPLWCWSVWALVLLVRGKSWKGVPQPKRFAAGVVVTALLTAVSLAYSTMYQPAAAPVHFILKAEFGTSRADKWLPLVHVPLKLYLKNDGGIPVYIINDDYTVYGRTADYSEGPIVRGWRKSIDKHGDEEADAELYVDHLEYTIISSGHVYGPGRWLEVGEEFTLQHVFQLPQNAKDFDTVSAVFQISYMRKDRGKLAVDEFEVAHHSWNRREGRYYCPPALKGCDERVIYHGRVRHNNNLVNVTRKPRYVTAIWSLFDRPVFSISSSFDFRRAKADVSEEKRELDRYGASTVHVDSEVSVAELMKSAGV
ncbi:hypothetical protein [Streptomyces sp. S.PNR 29]|uniref:hypothetical protein n=1 Tax=Streptomyces sp. S.PNR 29 TaxID=2973805 RepID=UPI0025B1678A|nr:hypothetical protein [Streptomyces sp. S.PNR 29]MDN0196804.1 hypothetical protein [Streptomyces sp. S.PNR 29]